MRSLHFYSAKSSVDSPWCLNEIGAFWGAGKRIILYSADHDVELPPLFKGDYRISDAREVIRQVREELEEIAKEAVLKTGAKAPTDSVQADTVKPKTVEEKEMLHASEKAEVLKHLTSRQKQLLCSYIEHGTRTLQLRYDEGAVVELIQADVLYHASNRASTIWTPGEYYTDVNMNLWAWKYLNEHPELIAVDKDKPDSV